MHGGGEDLFLATGDYPGSRSQFSKYLIYEINLRASLTRLPREPSVPIRETFPLEPRVAGDIALCENSVPSSDGGYVAGRSAGYENKAFIMKYDDLGAVRYENWSVSHVHLVKYRPKTQALYT